MHLIWDLYTCETLLSLQIAKTWLAKKAMYLPPPPFCDLEIKIELVGFINLGEGLINLVNLLIWTNFINTVSVKNIYERKTLQKHPWSQMRLGMI